MSEHMRCRLSSLIWFGAIGFVLAGLVAQSGPAQAQGDGMPLLWLAKSLERIERATPASTPTLRKLGIEAARGETESFQIVLGGQSRMGDARLTIGPLKGEAGAEISLEHVTLFRQHFVHLPTPSPGTSRGSTNVSLGAGWYSDALIPMATGRTHVIPVAVGVTTPLWVDVSVPRSAAPGRYAAPISIDFDGHALTAEIELTVWAFELPASPALNSAFLVWKDNPDIDEQLLRHRLMPRSVATQAQPALIKRWGLKSINIGLWSKATHRQCTMAPAPRLEDVKRAAANHHPSLHRYNYTADEIDLCPQQYDTMKAWGRVLHQAGVDNLVTMLPTRELYDDGSGSGRSAVDIWVLLPKMYEAAGPRVDEVRRKGDQVWSYNALTQDSYSPKWQIDYAPVNFRIQPGFMSRSLGLTGLLYWRVDLWSSAPWSDVYTYANEGGRYPGEGMLFYPGAPVGIKGVAPSLRLKWLRDGVDDYDYLVLLEAAGCASEAHAAAREIAQSWRQWSKDPEQLLRVRQRVGARLDALWARATTC